MEEALAGIHGERDFASFTKSGSDPASTICRVETTGVHAFPGGVVLALTADRFLYGMVRALVGALMAGGRRGEDPGFLQRLLYRRDRKAAGEAAPAAGLYFVAAGYPPDPVIPDRTGLVAGIAGLTEAPAPAEEPTP
jgi:tRNA pseudouridine38-40 synthase